MSENKTAENTKNQQSDNILEVSHLKKYFPIKGGMFGKQNSFYSRIFYLVRKNDFGDCNLVAVILK